MFTGIVEEMGSVAALSSGPDGWELVLRAAKVLEGTVLGDSIAVNGTCLTVTELGPDRFKVGVSPETRSRTNIKRLRSGDQVNLERAVTPQTRLGGHIVQGHVDGVGTLREKKSDGEALWLTLQAPPQIMRYVVPKGFICLDGASLTVVDVGADHFNVMLVAYTRQHIVLPQRKVGDPINIEADIVGKYVEKFMQGYLPGAQAGGGGGLTAEKLAEHGFA